MSDHTPTTVEVMNGYTMHQHGQLAFVGSEGRAEFDRWLGEERARTYGEGYRDAQDNLYEDRSMSNPYRKETP